MSDSLWSWQTQQSIPSQLSAAREIQEVILAQLEPLGWEERELFAIRLALEEALVNAIRHGNADDPTKEVRIACKLSGQKFWIEIADQGPGFDPCQVPDCTAPENLERCSGRGVMLMRSFMTLVEYNDQGNQVTLLKDRSLNVSSD